MGNGNAHGRTPNGARSRTPNPSWGTGTANGIAATLAAGKLLTPHGEREPEADALDLAFVVLLTPHGERELHSAPGLPYDFTAS